MKRHPSKRDFYLWLAGFVDGEGSIGVTSGPGRLRLRISNTNEIVLRYIQYLVGGWISGPKERGKNSKPHWTITISGTKGKTILEKILPFLVIKRKQAELAIQCPFSLSGVSLTKKEKDLRDKLKKEIAILNLRGKHVRIKCK